MNNINYKVLMYDGTIKPINEIVVGDQLMGPDSQPRNVIHIHIDYDDMINVVFNKNKCGFTFNENHKLVLKNFNKNIIELLPIKDCIKFRRKWKNHHRWIKTSVSNFDIKNNDFIIPPYMLGLLIGDGYLKKERIVLTTMDYEIKEHYESFINSFGYTISIYQNKNSKAFHLKYTKNIKENLRIKNNIISDPDKIRSEIRNLNLLGTKSHNKFIPQIYKTSSLQNRLELLAGLLDTDGYLGTKRNVFDFVSKSEKLSEDVVFIAKSCGLTTTLKEITKKNIKYYRVYIGGNTKIIPTKILRKQASNINHIKNIRILNPTFTLESIGKYQFHEITVDKDNLYLSDDFSIIHGL